MVVFFAEHSVYSVFLFLSLSFDLFTGLLPRVDGSLYAALYISYAAHEGRVSSTRDAPLIMAVI